MGGRQAALGGRAGGGVPESGGGIRCHLGQSREASHTPPPSRLQPGWQLPGAEEERSGLRDLGWTVVYTGHDCAARGSGGTVHGILRGEETEARCELNPGVSLNRLLARGP